MASFDAEWEHAIRCLDTAFECIKLGNRLGAEIAIRYLEWMGIDPVEVKAEINRLPKANTARVVEFKKRNER